MSEIDALTNLPITFTCLSNKGVETQESTVGAVLGADHVVWLLRQRHPEGCARARQAGAWMSSQLAEVVAYGAIVKALKS